MNTSPSYQSLILSTVSAVSRDPTTDDFISVLSKVLTKGSHADVVYLPRNSSEPWRVSFALHTMIDKDRNLDWLLWQICHDNYKGLQPDIIFPCTVNGIIMPLIESQYDFERYRGSILYSQRLSWPKMIEELIQPLNYPAAFIHLTDLAHSTSVEELFPEGLNSNIRILNYQLDRLDGLQSEIQSIFDIKPHQVAVKPTHSGILCVKSLPNTFCESGSLGVGVDVSAKFVRDVAQHLLTQSIPFTIWMDAGSIPEPALTNNLEKAQKAVNNSNYGLLYDGINIATPTLEYDPNNGSIMHPTTAYQAYIEYEGMVYDSLMAFYGVPVDEYQARLKSAWRQSHRVKQGDNLSTTLLALADLIEQAKYHLEN